MYMVTGRVVGLVGCNAREIDCRATMRVTDINADGEIQQQELPDRSSVITHEPRRGRDELDRGVATRDRSRSPLNRGEENLDAVEETINVSSSPIPSSEIFGCNSSFDDDTVSSYQSSLSSQGSNSMSRNDIILNPSAIKNGQFTLWGDTETEQAVRTIEEDNFAMSEIDEERLLLELAARSNGVSTPKRHRLAPPSRARYHVPEHHHLATLLHDHSWMDGCEKIIIQKKAGLTVREALAQAGVCLTAVIMETLQVCHTGFHIHSPENWHGKTQLTARALRLILPRLGLVDYAHEDYQKVYNSVQQFSGTYKFMKHSLDHGNFPEELEKLQQKALELRFMQDNPELARCERIQQKFPRQAVPTDLTVPRHRMDENNMQSSPCNDTRALLWDNEVMDSSPVEGAELIELKSNDGNDDTESIEPSLDNNDNDVEINQPPLNDAQPSVVDGADINQQSQSEGSEGPKINGSMDTQQGVVITKDPEINSAPPEIEPQTGLRLRDVNQMNPGPRVQKKLGQQENQQLLTDPGLKENQSTSDVAF